MPIMARLPTAATAATAARRRGEQEGHWLTLPAPRAHALSRTNAMRTCTDCGQGWVRTRRQTQFMARPRAQRLRRGGRCEASEQGG